MQQHDAELAVTRACNDLLDAQLDLNGMVKLAVVIEEASKKFDAPARVGLAAMLMRLALRLDRDAHSYVTQH
jgi:hypothetical protein